MDRIVNNVIRHEVGHWLSWRLQGGIVGDIEVINYSSADPKGSATIIFDREFCHISDVIKFTRSRIITLWSGVYAQAFDGHEYNASIIKSEFGVGGGRLDWLKAHEYLLLLKSLLGNKYSLECLHSEVDHETAVLIADNFDKIVKISSSISNLVNEKDKRYIFKENEILSLMH